MRENRSYGSEGGEVQKPSLPLSEATARGPWIASSQGLLAMTDGVIHVPQVDFLNSGRGLSAASEPPSDPGISRPGRCGVPRPPRLETSLHKASRNAARGRAL